MKLSIITINRNNAAGLRKTIESVVSQTYTDFEYIIIDGASTDESVDVIKEYASKIDYWVSEPDKGIYNAMNKGILKGQGEYLLFLNSGDCLHSYNVLDFIFSDTNNSDILLGDVRKIYSENKFEIEKSLLYFKNQNNEDISLFDMIHGAINHQSAIIKRILFIENGLYDENYLIVSDWKFFLKVIAFKRASLHYLNVVVSDYDMNGISNNNELFENERNSVLADLLENPVIDDYNYFFSLKWKYISMLEKYNYIFKYRAVFLIAKYLNKFLRVFESR